MINPNRSTLKRKKLIFLIDINPDFETTAKFRIMSSFQNRNFEKMIHSLSGRDFS
jgi:hypothetical protein